MVFRRTTGNLRKFNVGKFSSHFQSEFIILLGQVKLGCFFPWHCAVLYPFFPPFFVLFCELIFLPTKIHLWFHPNMVGNLSGFPRGIYLEIYMWL